jgi:hypothetical protein
MVLSRVNNSDPNLLLNKPQLQDLRLSRRSISIVAVHGAVGNGLVSHACGRVLCGSRDVSEKDAICYE